MVALNFDFEDVFAIQFTGNNHEATCKVFMPRYLSLNNGGCCFRVTVIIVKTLYKSHFPHINVLGD